MKNILYGISEMINMEEWLLVAYECGNLTRGDLRACLADKAKARDLWVEFCDSDDFVEDCQYQIEQFLEMVDEVV